MNDKKRQLLEVSIEDFDIALLRQAAREGRLFIAPEGSASGKQTPDNRQQLVASILTYVQPIAEYSTCPRVGEIWEAVLNDDRLAPLFFFSQLVSGHSPHVPLARVRDIRQGYILPTAALYPRRYSDSHYPLHGHESLPV